MGTLGLTQSLPLAATFPCQWLTRLLLWVPVQWLHRRLLQSREGREMRAVPTRQSFSKTVHSMGYPEQFEAAKAQRSLQPQPRIVPVKHEAPFHLSCKDCGAEGHSASLSDRILVWFFPDALRPCNGAFEPVECFDRQVGCGKCGSHKLEGVYNRSIMLPLFS